MGQRGVVGCGRVEYGILLAGTARRVRVPVDIGEGPGHFSGCAIWSGPVRINSIDSTILAWAVTIWRWLVRRDINPCDSVLRGINGRSAGNIAKRESGRLSTIKAVDRARDDMNAGR